MSGRSSGARPRCELEAIPWWAALYIALFGGLVVFGAIVDLRGSKRPAWHVAFDVVSGTVLILLMIARWEQHLITSLGVWAAAVFIIIVAWDVYSTRLDLAELGHDSDLTPGENEAINWIGVLAGGLIVAPAYALALFSVVQSWHGV